MTWHIIGHFDMGNRLIWCLFTHITNFDSTLIWLANFDSTMCQKAIKIVKRIKWTKTQSTIFFFYIKPCNYCPSTDCVCTFKFFMSHARDHNCTPNFRIRLCLHFWSCWDYVCNLVKQLGRFLQFTLYFYLLWLVASFC